MSAGGLTFTLIVVAELIALFRLLLPHIIAWGQARHEAIYDLANGDWPHVPTINQPRGD